MKKVQKTLDSSTPIMLLLGVMENSNFTPSVLATRLTLATVKSTLGNLGVGLKKVNLGSYSSEYQVYLKSEQQTAKPGTPVSELDSCGFVDCLEDALSLGLTLYRGVQS